MPGKSDLEAASDFDWRKARKLVIGLIAMGGCLAVVIALSNYLVMLVTATHFPSAAFESTPCQVHNASTEVVSASFSNSSETNTTKPCTLVVTVDFSVQTENRVSIFRQKKSLPCYVEDSNGQHFELMNQLFCYTLKSSYQEWINVFNCAEPKPPCVTAFDPSSQVDIARGVGLSLTACCVALVLFYLAVSFWDEDGLDEYIVASYTP